MPQSRRPCVTASFGAPPGFAQKSDKIDIVEKPNHMKATGEQSPWSCSTAAPSPDMTPLFEYNMSSPNPWVGQDWTGGILLSDFAKNAEFTLPEAVTPETKQVQSPPRTDLCQLRQAHGFDKKTSGGPSSQLLGSLAGFGHQSSYLAVDDNGQGPAFVVPRAVPQRGSSIFERGTSIFGSIFENLDEYTSMLENPVPKQEKEVAKKMTLPPGLEHVVREPMPAVQEELPIPPGTVTVMIRNLPNKYTRELLQARLDEQFLGKYDFLYLPVDFRNRCNMGYAFVNFRSYEDCAECTRLFHGRAVQDCLPGYNSVKVCAVSPARVQGCSENVRRLRSSPVMAQLMNNKQWLPQLFDKTGQPISFPEPDQPLPAWESGGSVKSRGKGRVNQQTTRFA
jgi:hypothetical protein